MALKATAMLAVLLLIMSASSAAAADNTVIKLATLAPDGSIWHKVLEEMGSEWRERTDGRVTLRLYAGGVAGDDPDMVRKIRIGQLHASSVTVAGLADIDTAFLVFNIPMFYESDEEFKHVLQGLAEELAARLESKGFILLHWGHGGWVHLFSKQPVRTVDDLKKVKLFSWAGDDRIFNVWKSAGFRPVALASTDILTGLQTGLIDGFPTTPLAALSMQWFRQTDYMLEPGVAPLMGATIISRKAWDRISERDRAAVLEAAERAERRLMREIPQKDEEAIEEMKKRGLKPVGIEPGQRLSEWKEIAEYFAAKMRSSIVPEEIFAAALWHRAEFRDEHSRKAQTESAP
jgi:TRAP-type C4-dicarboxylate transport system substrate-binding protein